MPLLQSFHLENVAVLADKTYDADFIIDHIEQGGGLVVIPSKSNRLLKRDYDRDIYKDRFLVENFFCKIKMYRRVATRYDKLADTFLAFATIASIMVWLA